ncbi:MAG: hypothetical protein WCW40_03995 [Bacteroidota bacterium]
MKTFYSLVSLLVMLSVSLILQSCNETTNPAASTSSIDPLLIGAWYDSTNHDGVEISSDGTIRHLTVNTQGKLAYASEPDYVSGKVTKASEGVLATEEKYIENNATVTYVGKGRYTFTNSGANLTIYLDSTNGQAVNRVFHFIKKSIGATVSGGSTGTQNTLSLTVDGQTYNFTDITVTQTGTTIDISAAHATVPYFTFFTVRTVGSHAIDGDTTGMWFEFGSKTYTSSSGFIGIGTITGKNTQGSFSVVVQEQFNPQNVKAVTGLFDVNLP